MAYAALALSIISIVINLITIITIKRGSKHE